MTRYIRASLARQHRRCPPQIYKCPARYCPCLKLRLGRVRLCDVAVNREPLKWLWNH
ncbi:hypothetical protein B0I35DRAFT_437712 [Stachybotrys elegans]|uniref:Uncharacterized protein n=1 Tax=Stachybotrys elegans TaxID=80388 RepID=A0A8K0WNW2_9HYPO|nr:hypothetical protein B0I35DRAFT_437712 [Stachybotrys elegans]